MGGDQHGTALIAELAQQADDPRFGLHIDAGERFIQQDHLTLLSDGAGKKDALFLPAGELANLPMAELAHAHAGQRGIDNFAIARLCPPQPAHMAVAAHHHHILHQHREGPVHLFRLRDIGDQILAQRAIDRLAEYGDLAVTDAHKAHQRFKQRGFTRAVNPHQRGNGAAWYAERGVAQGGVAVAPGNGELVDIQTRLRCIHGCFLIPSWIPLTMVSVVTRSRSSQVGTGPSAALSESTYSTPP